MLDHRQMFFFYSIPIHLEVSHWISLHIDLSLFSMDGSKMFKIQVCLFMSSFIDTLSHSSHGDTLAQTTNSALGRKLNLSEIGNDV